VIRVTRNHHRSGIANGDILRIEAVNGDGSITVRRGLDRDPATGARPDHPDTVITRGNLAFCVERSSRSAEWCIAAGSMRVLCFDVG
jgi:hypothetical protein